VAVNPVTNKIYIPGAIIDGATNSITTLSAGGSVVGVNPVTNKIYVANAGAAGAAASVTVIDGATNSTTTITDPNTNSLTPFAIAVNPATNKIYVANRVSDFTAGASPGNITEIDGATNSTTTITDPNAISPYSVAVNSATNKIYVANGGDYPGLNHGNITVIDGATNAITTLTDPNALAPRAVAVNEATNKIYVANGNDSALDGNGRVTIIDGATNAISSVSDPNGSFPNAITVDSANNTIYVTNDGCYPPADPCTNPGFVTVINGVTNSVATLINPNASHSSAVAVNATTNKIYVTNGSGNVTVIDGSATATSHIVLVALAGNGSGTVASTPTGINCGTSCLATFASGTVVNLTASPASGSRLSGWSAACAGTNACDLTMTSDEFVLAAFGPSSDFSLQSASASLTAQLGGQVTDVITIAPLSGGSFDSPIQLNCGAVNPTIASPTCALSPSSVTPGASSVTSTLTITASTQSAVLIPSKSRPSSSLYAALVPIPLALVGFGLTFGKSKQRRLQLWLLCSLFLGFIAIQAGCGGGSSGQTQPQNYIVIVTATSGSIQHTAQVTVTVQ
jgi:DNA-binding beta-propeller fold protein YncE